MITIIYKARPKETLMARTSRDVTALRREAVVQAAARLFRQRGVDAVSVPDLMGEAGLTHGGFYRHFASKDALEAEAYGRGLEQMAELVWSLIERHDGDGDGARQALFDHYLSARHRDEVGQGCPTAALACDAARKSRAAPLRVAVGQGVERMIDILERLSAAGGPDTRAKALANFSTLVGAIVLARATAGAALSDEFLKAARSSLDD
jgi:TetR/AcrR family transcriptional repressor of nem operon